MGRFKFRWVHRAGGAPWRGALFVLILTGMACHAAVAQTRARVVQSPTDPITGGPTPRQLVPTAESRPAPSPLEFRNLVQRPEDDRQSIAGLLKNVQGEDGTIEVVVGRGRLLTLQEPLADPEGSETPVVAVGDPTAVDFDILPSSRMIRILGRRIGTTDLSVITANGKAYTFVVRVVYDLNLLRAYLKQMFPNANLSLVQMYEHVVVEGEASSTDEVHRIILAIQSYLNSSQIARKVESTSRQAAPGVPRANRPEQAPSEPGDNEEPAVGDGPALEGGIDDKPDVSATLPTPQVINLIRVPGVQQIMLQVKIAELDRTAFRQMGASVLYRDSSGRTLGSTLGSGSPVFDDATQQILGLATGTSNTAFAILPSTTLSVVLDALRSNQIINVLAEPNLMAMHGQKASFLAGGEFPVPVPQGGTAGNTFTIEFKEFGVLLDFVPYIMENGAIRLHVAPEVSTVDPTLSVDLPGFSVPGVNTRRANTTVELHQGQTLALAGLLQVELEAQTARLPGLGDLPYLGPFFSNNSHERKEKELMILVTPHFVEALDPHQVGPLPGHEIRDPDDHEFYWLNRIESRAPHVHYRATNGWDDPLGIRAKKMHSATNQMYGPCGFSSH